MSSLVLDEDLIFILNNIKNNLPNVNIFDNNIDNFSHSILSLSDEKQQILYKIGNLIQHLLNENAFTVIKGLNASDDIKNLLMIAMSFGKVYTDLSQNDSIINETNPNIQATVQGNQLKKLFLHTDFAMLERPPNATLIECKKLDPLGIEFGKNGIATAQDIISLYYGTAELELILNTPMPFSAITPSGNHTTILKPALKLNDNNVYEICFHPSRIHYGFRLLEKMNIKPTKEQLDVLHLLQKMAFNVRQEIQLNVGDILIVNNRTALHDRTTCNLKMNSKGELQSRISNIVFVQEFYHEQP